MTDKIRDREQAVLAAAFDLVEAEIENREPGPYIRAVKRKALYLMRACHERDVYRRSMPKKRVKK